MRYLILLLFLSFPAVADNTDLLRKLTKPNNPPDKSEFAEPPQGFWCKTFSRQELSFAGGEVKVAQSTPDEEFRITTESANETLALIAPGDGGRIHWAWKDWWAQTLTLYGVVLHDRDTGNTATLSNENSFSITPVKTGGWGFVYKRALFDGEGKDEDGRVLNFHKFAVSVGYCDPLAE